MHTSLAQVCCEVLQELSMLMFIDKLKETRLAALDHLFKDSPTVVV